MSSTASSEYILDTPQIRELIAEAHERMGTTADDAERLELLKPTFQKLLQADGWLPDKYAQPADTTGMGGGIAAYALYRAADASLCLFSFVIPAGATTPVNDHGSWGLVGIYRGRQEETYYDRTDDGSVEGKAVLEMKERQTLDEGEFYPLLPGVRDIHTVGSQSDSATISIHLLANDTGCVDRRQYDLQAQTVTAFRSGWSNVPCNDTTS